MGFRRTSIEILAVFKFIETKFLPLLLDQFIYRVD